MVLESPYSSVLQSHFTLMCLKLPLKHVVLSGLNGKCSLMFTVRTLFASSVLNLCEMVSLRPDLARLHKVLYFHENQLVYPVRKQQERDFQYGYNQIISW